MSDGDAAHGRIVFVHGMYMNGASWQPWVDRATAAGVAVSSAPAPGVVSLDPRFFRANFPHVNPLAGNKPVVMTPATPITSPRCRR
jgi:hypothetical protein